MYHHLKPSSAIWALGLVLGAFALLVAMPVWAQEQRFALLVGNQFGWQGEPPLDYALSGDVRPLAARLKGLGFHVRLLENQNATTLRQTFKEITALFQREHRYKTFLFYYSGHADQRSFHLGSNRKRPLSYQEFAHFFNGLPAVRKIAILDSCYSGEVIRRFGSLTRYQKLLKLGKMKGIRARRKIDLHRLIVPKQGHELGIRIIASSLDVSWELRQHKASVFTFYLLRGLKGPADTNQDGRITVDELFDYTTQRVLQETGQRPQQFLLLRRSTPYAIAPVYRSRLRIGPEVVGDLKVAVANFVWSQKKRHHRPLRLAVVDGKGVVSLEHKGQCWRQFLRFPKGGEVGLNRRWIRVPCRRLARRRKGTIYLQARALPRPAALMTRSLAVSGNFVQTHVSLLERANWGGGLQLRLGRHFGLGVHFITGKAQEPAQFMLTTVWLRPEFGWRKPFSLGHFDFDLFLGVYAQAGLTFQHKSSAPDLTRAVFGVGGGSLLDLSWWFAERFGLRFGGLAGFNFTPVLDQPSFSFQWQLQTALLFRF